MVVIFLIQEGFTGGSSWPDSVASIPFITRRKIRVGGSSPSPFVAQLPLQTINLQLHGSSAFLMRDVTPTSRVAPTSMGGMHTNLVIPSSLKIHKMILTLGPRRFLSIQTWTYHNWTLKSLQHQNFPTDGTNCKDAIWVLSPKVKKI